MKSVFTRSLIALAIGSLALIAHATPITGQLDLSGGVNLNTNDLSTATAVNGFFGVTVALPAGVTPGSVLDSTIDPGMAVTMVASPWVFGTGQLAIWSVGGFTFNLLTSTTDLNPDPAFISVSGTGTITGNGYDPTPGLWTFSVSTPGGMGDNSNFSFQSSTLSRPQSVPDSGASVALLGLGLIGLAGVRRFTV